MAELDMDTSALEGMPPEVRGLFFSALEHVQTGEDSLQYAWDELRKGAIDTLNRAETALASAHDEIVGAAVAHLDRAEQTLQKPLKQLYTKADNALLEASGSLMNGGWRFPYTIDEMRYELNDGIENHVLARVPELAAAYQAMTGQAPELTPPSFVNPGPGGAMYPATNGGDVTIPPVIPGPIVLPPPVAPPLFYPAPPPVIDVIPPPPPPPLGCVIPPLQTIPNSDPLPVDSITGVRFTRINNSGGIATEETMTQCAAGSVPTVAIGSFYWCDGSWNRITQMQDRESWIAAPPFAGRFNGDIAACYVCHSSGTSPPPPPCPPPGPGDVVLYACPPGYEPIGNSWVAWHWDTTLTPPNWIEVGDSGGQIPGVTVVGQPPHGNPSGVNCIYTGICRPIAVSPPPPPPPTCPPTTVTCPAQVCCPPPKTLTIGDASPDEPAKLDVAGQTTNICAYMDELVGSLRRDLEPYTSKGYYDVVSVGARKPNIFEVVFKHLPGIVANASAETMGPALRDAIDFASNNAVAKELLQTLSGGVLDDPATASVTGAMIAASKLVESKIGFPFTYLMRPVQYAMQYTNPNGIPTQADTNLLYIMGAIEDDDWQCLTEMNGNLAHLARYGRDLAIGHIDVRDTILLRRRKLLESDTEMYSHALRAGWRDKREVDLLWNAMLEYPGPSDLVRFMVRDVFDPAVVKQYQYDKDFETKTQGQAGDLIAAAGVPLDIMKYHWFAHWQIPSNTQLYSMVQRQRPDTPAVKEWDQSERDIGREATIAKLGPRPPVVTIDDVRRALEINDVAPAWIEPLLAISYNPITRTDAVRAFEIGSFTAEQLTASFQDNGYNRKDSELLTKFHVEEKARKLANATGVLTIRKVITYYREQTITREDAERLLQPLVINDTDRASLLDRTDAEIQANYRRITIQGIRRAFVFGEIDVLTAQARLNAIGVPPSQMALLIGRWQAEMANRLREPTVRMLCNWYNHRIITAEDYYQRLRRLGWDVDDANRILLNCDQDWKAKLAKAEAALAKEQQAKLEKELKSAYQIEHATDQQLQRSIEKEQQRIEKLVAEQNRRKSSGNGKQVTP